MDKDTLSKRMKTTMIAALDEFEKSFGYLWGNHKDNNTELTPREEQFLDIWEDTRNRILNRGNNQIRKAISDLNQNNTTGPRYNYRFNTQKGSNNEQ